MPSLEPTPPTPLSPRKIILVIILAGSILFFFLILFAGAVAILREAAPTGHSGLFLMVKHAIAHHHNIFHRK